MVEDSSTSPAASTGQAGQADGSTTFATALPSTGARILALVSIVVAGLCGGLIGFGITDLETGRHGGSAAAIGGVVGAVLAAAGVAVVAVLVLRAMGEWRVIEHRAAATGQPIPKPVKRPS